MIKLTVYSAKGKKDSTMSAPKEWALSRGSLALLAQAIRVYEARSHTGLASVKTRGEVQISTRKIYKQKGTGGARHGARSAPIFVGGGIAHGPRPVERQLKMSKRLSRAALKVALGEKAKAGELVVIADLKAPTKTSQMAQVINSVRKDLGKTNGKFTLILAQADQATSRVARNIKDLVVLPFSNLTARDVLAGGIVAVQKSALGAKPK